MGQLIAAERNDNNPEGRISVRVLTSDERIWVKPSNTRPVQCHPDMPYNETEVVYSEHTLKNLQEVGLGVPVLLEVKPVAAAVVGMCHQNVEAALQDGDEHVFGYEITVCQRCCGCVNFALHSVLRRNGALLDISPDVHNETVKYFVEDPIIEYAGNRPARSPNSVTYSASFTSDLIAPFIHETTTCKFGILHCGNAACVPRAPTNPYLVNETRYYKLRSTYIEEQRA
jgi:hypothetical protein